jgi:TPR repeat protein
VTTVESAQYNLASLYYDGEGVVQEFALAHLWFNVAAANGDDNGSKNRDIVAAKMT